MRLNSMDRVGTTGGTESMDSRDSQRISSSLAPNSTLNTTAMSASAHIPSTINHSMSFAQLTNPPPSISVDTLARYKSVRKNHTPVFQKSLNNAKKVLADGERERYEKDKADEGARRLKDLNKRLASQRAVRDRAETSRVDVDAGKAKLLHDMERNYRSVIELDCIAEVREKVYANEAELVAQFEHEIEHTTKERLVEKLESLVKAELGADLEEQVRQDLRAELETQVKRELREEHEQSVKKQLMIDLKDSVRSELKSMCQDEVRAELKRELTPIVRQNLENNLRPQTTGQRSSDISNHGLPNPSTANYPDLSDYPTLSNMPHTSYEPHVNTFGEEKALEVDEGDEVFETAHETFNNDGNGGDFEENEDDEEDEEEEVGLDAGLQVYMNESYHQKEVEDFYARDALGYGVGHYTEDGFDYTPKFGNADQDQESDTNGPSDGSFQEPLGSQIHPPQVSNPFVHPPQINNDFLQRSRGMKRSLSEEEEEEELQSPSSKRSRHSFDEDLAQDRFDIPPPPVNDGSREGSRGTKRSLSEEDSDDSDESLESHNSKRTRYLDQQHGGLPYSGYSDENSEELSGSEEEYSEEEGTEEDYSSTGQDGQGGLAPPGIIRETNTQETAFTIDDSDDEDTLVNDTVFAPVNKVKIYDDGPEDSLFVQQSIE